ncbi:MAG: hypothetical protein AAGC68_13490, partial [Verrucomicrobiota bacterium]
MDSSSFSENRGWFPETSWSCVQKVKDGDEKAAREALETLCSIYRGPIVTALRHKHGFSVEESEDIAQEFIVWFLDSGTVNRAEQTEGRFRSYLLTCLDYFSKNQRRKWKAERRGGQATHISIDPDPELGQPGIELPSD